MLYKRIFWKSQQERLWDVLRNTRYLETNGRKQVMRKEGKSSIIHACTLLESPSQSRFIECVLSHFSRVQLCVTLWTAACQAPPSKNIGVGCHALLQGIFLTQGSNPCLLCLLHWQGVLYHLHHHIEYS